MRARTDGATRCIFPCCPLHALLTSCFCPHSTVRELTSNRIVLGNVLLPDISFVDPSTLKSLSVKSRSDSQLYILSWTLEVNPGAAAAYLYNTIYSTIARITLYKKLRLTAAACPAACSAACAKAKRVTHQHARVGKTHRCRRVVSARARAAAAHLPFRFAPSRNSHARLIAEICSTKHTPNAPSFSIIHLPYT